jgi:hypothetical protein
MKHAATDGYIVKILLEDISRNEAMQCAVAVPPIVKVVIQD